MVNFSENKMKINFRVQIIVFHFANSELNSSYCDCKFVNHMKNAYQFFPKENLILPHYIFPYYLHIYPSHTNIIQRNIANTQNYITKCKTCFTVLKKKFSFGRVKTSLRLADLLRSEFQRIIPMVMLFHFNH